MTPINDNCSLFSTFQGSFHLFIALPQTKGTNYYNLTSGHPDVLLSYVLLQTLSEIMVIAFSYVYIPPLQIVLPLTHWPGYLHS